MICVEMFGFKVCVWLVFVYFDFRYMGGVDIICILYVYGRVGSE